MLNASNTQGINIVSLLFSWAVVDALGVIRCFVWLDFRLFCRGQR